MKTIELEKTFDGRGETKGFKFKQLKKSKYGYIYEVSSTITPHYEVFRRVVFPLCIDFKEKIFSETEEKVNYPKRNAFGKTAWTCMKLKRANARLKEIDAHGSR